MGQVRKDDGLIGTLVDRYVRELMADGAIRSGPVERAFRTVPRHRLVETFYHWTAKSQDSTPIHHDPEHSVPGHLELIYSNTALGTRFVDGMPASSTSQPSLVAEMLELLELAPGIRVLEVGAGTGYNAALMAEIVGEQSLITTVDIQQDVVEQTRRLLAQSGYGEIEVLHGDGFDGTPARAPFDRIVATVGCPDLSPRWSEQLAASGFMLIPLEHAAIHPLVQAKVGTAGLHGLVVGWSGFMPMQGTIGQQDLWPRGFIIPGGDRGPAKDQIQEEPGFPELGTGERLGGSDRTRDETDFHFFLAISDPRACWGGSGIGLSEGTNGWAAGGDGKLRWMSNRSLAEELTAYYHEWQSRGRPGIRDYRLSFEPRDAEPGVSRRDGTWILERRFYREVITL